jgi:hypothetical protein
MTKSTDKSLCPSGAATSAAELAKGYDRINWLEKELAARFQHQEMPVTNRFTPGLYSREIFMPAGTMLTSKIHKTEHPYVVLSGKVSVWTNDGDEVVIEGPYVGITQPGTRRVLYIHEDTRWITFHPSEETDLVKLEQQLIEPHDFPKVGVEQERIEGESPCRGLLSE